MVLDLVQDRCTVCAKRTTGSDIVFNALMVLLGDEAQLLILMQDRSTVCVEHTIGSEIIFDAADGAPR